LTNRSQKEKSARNAAGKPPPPARKPKTGYVWLTVLPKYLRINVPQGTTIWEALQKSPVNLEGECGGLGKCGKCRIKVLSAAGPATPEERKLLNTAERKEGIRLACQTKIKRDMAIAVGETDPDEEYFQILTTSHFRAQAHLPLPKLEPLVEKRPVTLPPSLQREGFSYLERIRLALAPEYQGMKSSLSCLRKMPGQFKKNGGWGTAVLHGPYLLDWQKWEEAYRHFGLVYDLGTSTLVGKLINLVDGSEVSIESRLNSQIRHGTNVISRIQYIREHPEGLFALRDLLIRDLNLITGRLLKSAGIKPSDVLIAVAAGNTTMQHILLAVDPSGIGEAPFAAVMTDGVVTRTTEVGLALHPEALFYVMPAKSGYIGGDLISVIIASGATEQEEEMVLGLDLGTNGEIFLGNGRRMVTCSAAAGPALEGARITHGMIASAGAIEGVSFSEGLLQFRVIGNVKPKGLCGSGLVELAAVLLDHGVIDSEGLIRPAREVPAAALRGRIISRGGVNSFLIASPEESHQRKPVYLNQRDVRELQLAKGAIAAGVQTLMSEMGITLDDIDRVYLAGALGNYVNPESAMRIGLIPRFRPEIISSLGNAASSGANIVILSRKYWQRAVELSRRVEHIELSSRTDFNELFVEKMDFPPPK